MSEWFTPAPEMGDGWLKSWQPCSPYCEAPLYVSEEYRGGGKHITLQHGDNPEHRRTFASDCDVSEIDAWKEAIHARVTS